MNKNKILIELEIPLIEAEYDLFIPINKKVGTIKNLIEEALTELTNGAYKSKEDSNLYSKEGNGAIVKINGHKCYLKLSYNESIELYDFDEEKYTSAKLEDILGYKVESHKNSLLRTNEENIFIYAYITTGNYLMMQKFKVVSNDASNCIQLIKTSLESVKTISKNSRRAKQSTE